MDDKQVARELMKLAKALTADDLTVIADAFTRYCIGDRDYAIKQLTAMKNKPFEGNLIDAVNSGKYVKIFNRMIDAFLKVLKSELPVK